jgi:hypothetical protein
MPLHNRSLIAASYLPAILHRPSCMHGNDGGGDYSFRHMNPCGAVSRLTSLMDARTVGSTA